MSMMTFIYLAGIVNQLQGVFIVVCIACAFGAFIGLVEQSAKYIKLFGSLLLFLP
jgi:hypothetical protein